MHDLDALQPQARFGADEDRPGITSGISLVVGDGGIAHGEDRRLGIDRGGSGGAVSRDSRSLDHDDGQKGSNRAGSIGAIVGDGSTPQGERGEIVREDGRPSRVSRFGHATRDPAEVEDELRSLVDQATGPA